MALLVATPANAIASDCGATGNIVQNCGFETGDFTNWSNPNGAPVDTSTPHSGTYEWSEGYVGSERVVSQTLSSAQPNTGYTACMWVYVPGSGTTSESMTASNVVGGSVVIFSEVDGPQYVYRQVCGTFTTLGSGSPTLSIGVRNDPDYTQVDDVSVVPNTATTPGAPTNVSATPGDQSATVSFDAPLSPGSSPILGYTVRATDFTTPANGGQIATGTGSPITVTGLTNGDTYSFTVSASNSQGEGTLSDRSNEVVPSATPASPTPSASPPPPKATASPSASATATATTSPSATPTASTSPSATPPARQSLTLSNNSPNIPAGSTASLTATGAANQAYELRCYTRPSTTYVTARSGSFDAAGNPVDFTLSLGRNTRCFIQYGTSSSQGASGSVVVNVHTVLSLSAIRNAVQNYTFQGRNLPRVAGQLITLYRVDAAGNEIRTSNLVTDDSGTYRVTRQFTGSGTFQFRVRTSQTLNNAAGSSNTITVNVH